MYVINMKNTAHHSQHVQHGDRWWLWG